MLFCVKTSPMPEEVFYFTAGRNARHKWGGCTRGCEENLYGD